MSDMQKRIFSLVKVFLDRSEISAAYKPIILKFVQGYVEKTNEETIRAGVKELQEVIIPFILGEETAANENSNTPNP